MDQLDLALDEAPRSSHEYLKRIGAVGLLNEIDVEELKGGVKRVFDLMKNGGWYSRREIELAAGRGLVPAAEGMRRMRELRQWFIIETVRNTDNRSFIYRLCL